MIPPPPPPAAHELRAGTQLVAGLGHATVLPDIDFETYGEAGYVWDPHYRTPSGKVTPKWRTPDGTSKGAKGGLPLVGAEVYARHPTAEVLACSYDLKDGHGKRRWYPGQPMPQDLRTHIEGGGLIEAHNAGFERKIWNHVLAARHGWCRLPLEQQRCSAAKSLAFGLPRALFAIQQVRGGAQKDPEGKRLMDKFSMPRNPTAKDPRRRIRMEEEPEEAEAYRAYCDQDIVAEADVSAGVPDLIPMELEWWQADQRCNDLGVAIDLVAVNAAIKIVERALRLADEEVRIITGGVVQRASELSKLSAWLADTCGVYMDAMDDEAITSTLKSLRAATHRDDPQLHAAIRVLALRQGVGSASVKKLYQMRNCASTEGRLHDLFNYHAAKTGRDTGNGAQPTNLPNSGPDVWCCGSCGKHYGTHRGTCAWCGSAARTTAKPREWNAEAANDAIEVIYHASLGLLADAFGDPLGVISACLRGMFVAGPGRELISSDFTAIEAVVAAMMAGEQWRVTLFENRGKLYEASAATMLGLAYDDLLDYAAVNGSHHPARKKGKVAELALAYGGWIGAMANFGADEWMTEEEMKSTIIAWRQANPAIVEYWGGQYRGMPWDRNRSTEYFGLEGAAIQAVLNPGRAYQVQGAVVTLAGAAFTPPPITYLCHGDVLYMTLPSGRSIAYHRPRLAQNDRDKWGFSYALSYEGWNTNQKKGPIGWIRMQLYGGLQFENVCQAVARDVLVHAVVNQNRAGYPTVLRVYDEIVAEVPFGFGSVEEFEAIMGKMPGWAAGWPIRAHGGWRGYRYRK